MLSSSRGHDSQGSGTRGGDNVTRVPPSEQTPATKPTMPWHHNESAWETGKDESLLGRASATWPRVFRICPPAPLK